MLQCNSHITGTSKYIVTKEYTNAVAPLCAKMCQNKMAVEVALYKRGATNVWHTAVIECRNRVRIVLKNFFILKSTVR